VIRTLQDLLAERRASVLEMYRERDASARAMVRYHILALDAEIVDRTRSAETVDESGDSDYAWEREPAHLIIDSEIE
jgi:hypothetical protein